MSTTTVRAATPADAAACAAVYAPYVTGTAASFETEPPAADEVAGRIVAALERHAWLVAEREGRVVGYAYATAYRSRPAYRWTCEVSVYVAAGEQRGGVGRALYAALLQRLAQRGFRTALAAMTLPNPASAALHEAMGFVRCGVLPRVGWKAGHWHDVALFHRPLGDAGPLEEGQPPETV